MPCGQRGVGPVGKVLKNSKLTGPPKPWLCSEASKYLVFKCGFWMRDSLGKGSRLE